MQYYLTTPDPVYVETDESAQQWAAYYHDRPWCGVDTETTGLHKLNARVKFFSLADKETRICAPVRLLPWFGHYLESNVPKVLANRNFDRHMLFNHGIDLGGTHHDVVHMDWHLDENREGRHGLKDISHDYLRLRMSPFKEVFGHAGSKNEEVAMVSHLHDVLETRDRTEAYACLLDLERLDGPPSVLKTLAIFRSRQIKRVQIPTKDLILYAKRVGMIPEDRTRNGAAMSFFRMFGEEFPVEVALPLFRDSELDLLPEARALLFQHCMRQVHIPNSPVQDPLDFIRLLVADYASLDAWATVAVHRWLAKALEKDHEDETRTVYDRYRSDGVAYTSVLWNMERRGIKVDLERLSALAVPLRTRLGVLERELVQTVGYQFNIKSGDQLLPLFYHQTPEGDWVDDHGDPPIKMTSGGVSGVRKPSVDESVLEHWEGRGHALAAQIMEHRRFSKLCNTYLDTLPLYVDGVSRVHTTLNQKARTGRLASVDPNLLNQPVRSEEGKQIRTVFVAGRWGDVDPFLCLPEVRHVPLPDLPPDEPMVLIVSDYNQIEVKLTAHVSQDPTMLHAVRTGDLHAVTAANNCALQGLPYTYEDIVRAKKTPQHLLTPLQQELIDRRAAAKAVLFGIIYGIGPARLGAQLGLPLIRTSAWGRTIDRCPEGERLIENFYRTYPGVRVAIDDTIARCKDTLFVQTVTGRKRRLPDILSTDRGRQKQAERQAFNSVIQGSAADIIELVMIAIERDVMLRAMGARMLLQVHDELILECPLRFKDAAVERVKHLMESIVQLLVPLTVDIHSVYCWAEAK